MGLKENLKQLQNYQKAIEDAKKKSVVVGLVKEKVSSKNYEDGQSVIEIGLAHEFGLNGLPLRSWLRTPFKEKEKEINDVMKKQFNNVFEKGLNVEKALGLVGAFATGVSQRAFTNRGYGNWAANAESTIARKGSSQVLVDTGILRNSITWVVR